jgi:hypothetical protein
MEWSFKMNINMIKKSVLSNRFSKPIIIILLCLILIYYFIIFFSPGILYGGVFLKKESTSSERIYSGNYDYDYNNDGNDDDEIFITVQGREDQDSSANVIFQYPENFSYYTVVFQDANNWENGIVSITDIDDNILFEGKYDKYSESFLNKNGQPFFVYYENSEDNFQTIFSDEFTVDQIVDVVYEENNRIQGEPRFLILALLLFFYTWIDYCYPLFFFRLNYGRAVYNPEPSESYEFWQRIRWIVLPIIGIILMIMAL